MPFETNIIHRFVVTLEGFPCSKRKDFPILESGAIDYKARKRIEELFLLTDELLRERSHETIRYDKKLYKKYKEMKEINKKLQEKLLDYHCSGCQCHRPNPAVQVVPSSSSTENVDNSRKLICKCHRSRELNGEKYVRASFFS